MGTTTMLWRTIVAALISATLAQDMYENRNYDVGRRCGTEIPFGESFRMDCTVCRCAGPGVAMCPRISCPRIAAYQCGRAWPQGHSFMDDCNRCRCQGVGNAVCTKMLCPGRTEEAELTINWNDAGSYCGTRFNLGESFMFDCNQCRCSEQQAGIAACTRMACPTTSAQDCGRGWPAGHEFMDECNTCRCSDRDVGVAACTAMECSTEGREVDPNDAGSYCGTRFNLGESFMFDCNQCRCSEQQAGIARCTRMACPTTAAQECGRGWSAGHEFMDDCNTCRCSDRDVGVAVCTEMECSTEGREEDLDDVGSYCGSRYGLGERFTFDCNQCQCSDEETGVARCTRMACPKTSAYECGRTWSPGHQYMDDCNTCTCSDRDIGVAACTLMACNEETDQYDPGRLCGNEIAMGEIFEVDCNRCRCDDIGVVTCTEEECPKTGHYQCGREWASGYEFMTDECTTCTCVEKSMGRAICTASADCSPSPNNVDPGSDNSEQDMDNPGRMCGSEIEMGEVFEVDCNRCRCDDVGVATCTREECPKTANYQCGREWAAGHEFMTDECTTCTCVEKSIGIAICRSSMDCLPNPNNVDPGSDGSEEEMYNPGRMCGSEIEMGEIFEVDCNRCRCDYVGVATCTEEECPKTAHYQCGREWTAGHEFMTDECTTCTCVEKSMGIATCTSSLDCLPNPNNRDPGSDNSEQEMENPGRMCGNEIEMGEIFEVDCNRCRCDDVGVATCTEEECQKTSAYQCGREWSEGHSFMDDCNTCTCLGKAIGKAACTRRYCPQDEEIGEPKEGGNTDEHSSHHGGEVDGSEGHHGDENDGSDGHHGNEVDGSEGVDGEGVEVDEGESSIQPGTPESLCTTKEDVGKMFQVDCNRCRCDEIGIATCTEEECPESIASKCGREWPAGHMFNDDCNTCHCSSEGIGQAGCTYMLCPSENEVGEPLIDDMAGSQKGVHSETDPEHENDILTDRGAEGEDAGSDMFDEIKPGDSCNVDNIGQTFAMDCNTCECLSPGQVACSAMECPRTASYECGREWPEDHQFIVDCNTCYCRGIGNSICTDNDCSSRLLIRK